VWTKRNPSRNGYDLGSDQSEMGYIHAPAVPPTSAKPMETPELWIIVQLIQASEWAGRDRTATLGIKSPVERDAAGREALCVFVGV
jgi:hypothetical protein